MSTDTPETSTSGPGARTARDSDDGMLVVDNLRKEFGGLVAVDDLSFAVQEQEILGFIGPNGAGKSTTFDCIMGAHKPTSGTVRYRDEDVTGYPGDAMIKRGMARTFQDFAPLDDRTVVENVALSLMPDRLVSTSGFQQETEEIAAEICRRVGLGNRLRSTPGELPHAGLLRLELARAIATDPDLVLVDEPFAGLSSQEVAEVSELLESLRWRGMTFIVVDHNMRGLLDLIDRAIVIQFGSKIAEGPPETITDDEAVQEAYLGDGM
jgi:branched-chain amino acid transport system ATP-binding protein